eukprot:scaffold71398_cov35-Prasinocladus_malaysianus.AAC.2
MDVDDKSVQAGGQQQHTGFDWQVCGCPEKHHHLGYFNTSIHCTHSNAEYRRPDYKYRIAPIFTYHVHAIKHGIIKKVR